MATLSELSEFIEETCNLDSDVTLHLQACRIDMKKLLSMKEKDFETSNINLSTQCVQRICACIQSEFHESSHSNISNSSDESESCIDQLLHISPLISKKKLSSKNSDTDEESPKERRRNPKKQYAAKRKIKDNNLDTGRPQKKKSKFNKDDTKKTVLSSKNRCTPSDSSRQSIQEKKSIEVNKSNSQSKNLSSSDDTGQEQSRNIRERAITSQLSGANNESFKVGDRLTYDTISAQVIKTILEDSLEGKAILSEYTQEHILENASRKLLVSLIVNRCPESLQCGAPKFFEKVANALKILFPEEETDLYYISPYVNGNETKNCKGLLSDKWRNVLYRMRKYGALVKQSKANKRSDHIPAVPEINSTIKGHMKWLMQHREPWDDVKEHWAATFDYRHASNKLHQDSVENILETDWPILKSKLGLTLIDFDFKQAYPDSQLSIEKNWEDFFINLYSIRRKLIKDNRGSNLLKKYEECLKNQNKSMYENYQVQLIPYLCPPGGKVKTGLKLIKPSTVECVEGFYVWCKTSADVDTVLNKRTSRYKAWKERVQPCLVFVGEDAQSIKNIYINLNNYFWKCKSALQGIDSLFKLYMMLNLQYPKDCKQAWLLIQRNIYNIHTDWDEKLPLVLSIEASLKHAFKNRSEKAVRALVV